MSCTFHRTGTFCSHTCPPCDRRMLSATQRTQARVSAQASILMRAKPNAR